MHVLKAFAGTALPYLHHPHPPHVSLPRGLPKTRSSLMFLMQNHRPAGKVHTRMCRSKKNDTQVVGWCSDTEAMMGMWILAYLDTRSHTCTHMNTHTGGDRAF